MLRWMVFCCLLSATGLVHAAGNDPKKEPGKKHPANHLAKESSPYLLQHAHNPVDWYPWGTAAFEKAKKEKKIVFLSIGYSSCHWCHVMERESFSNEAIAKIMNEHFVCIKVDREERPDIDQIYMTALQVQGQNGGWPLSMFLTSDGKPIIGGTYWPPEDKEIEGEKIHGFKSILNAVQEAKTTEMANLEKRADQVADATIRSLGATIRGGSLVELDRELVKAVVDETRGRFDKQYGGFGSPARKFKGTKFPVPSNLRLIQHEAARTKSDELKEILTVTLDKMAQGGIYDHLGGGFHRYSTERTWTVPHFEKMLYDNAQLVEVYSKAYRETKKPMYKRVVEDVLTYIEREMTGPEGAFYSALDADSEEEEGKFYVWEQKEIDAVFPQQDDARLFREVYGLTLPPNFESKFHILTLPETPAEQAAGRKLTEDELVARLTPLRKKMFDTRAKRPKPFLDTKVLTSWNGQMIAGYAVAGQMLEDPKYVEKAARAAEFIVKTLKTKDGRLLRTYGAAPGQKAEAKLNGCLDDYAYLIHGLLALHDAGKDKKWLDEAIALTDVAIKFFGDEKGGGFFYTSSDHEKLFARGKDQHDGAQPSGNSTMALNLVRLYQKTGQKRYSELAETTFKTFSPEMKVNGFGLAMMAEALALYLDGKEKK